MTKRRLSEAERLRRHNEEMKLAMAENLPLAEARRRLNEARWSETLARLHRVGRCGTLYDDRQRSAPASPPTSAALVEEQPRFWWQDERL